jgi:hypothetical protein
MEFCSEETLMIARSDKVERGRDDPGLWLVVAAGESLAAGRGSSPGVYSPLYLKWRQR